MTTGQELLCKVFGAKADDVAGKSDEYCSELLDGALRFKFGTLKLDGLEATVEDWLFTYWKTLEPISAEWPTEPVVATLVNGYDGDFGLFVYPIPPRMRQDAHVIAISRKETTVTDSFTGDKEFVEVEKHQSPAGVEVAPKEAVAVLEVAMIANIAALGNMGLAAKTVRQLKAMCRLLEVKIGGHKADIVARLACLAGLEPVPWAKAPEAEETVAGDPMMYLVTLAELLPRLSHRTSDGRWYLKGYRINFVLETNGQVLRWSQKGLVPNKWTKFAGEAMLVPAVIVVPASSAS